MKVFRFLLYAGGLAALILDTQTAVTGAGDGIELCIRSVIPSLFPFLFLSALLIGSMPASFSRILRPVGRLCRIPEGGESLLALGLIGGYPVGAQTLCQAYLRGSVDRDSGRRMLGFCSNAGPSFIFGFMSGTFPLRALWAIWLIQIASALLTGFLLPGGTEGRITEVKTDASTPLSALERSIRVMAQICGWVVVFRILLSFLQRWFLWLVPTGIRVLLSGCLELTNGCAQLPPVQPTGLGFILASAMLTCGGVCVALQTASVTRELGLGLYLPGKIIQTAISMMLAWGVQHWLFPTEQQYHGWNSLFPVISAACCVFIIIFFKFLVAFWPERMYNEKNK